MSDYALKYSLFINLAALLFFGWDKLCAIKNWSRVNEKKLLALASVGGCFGALIGMQLLRHKIRKNTFMIRFAAAFTIGTAINIGLAILAYGYI